MEQKAAHLLLNKKINDKWYVKEKIKEDNDSSDRKYSVGYIVEDDKGNRGFLKAFDYSRAFEDPDFTILLEAMTKAFNYEVTLLQKCKDHKLAGIVRSIDYGNVKIEEAIKYPDVSFLVFELADYDVRKYLSLSKKIDIAWALRSLHHVSVGLMQLHGIEIAHQDLKPANVLIFSKQTKIGDLGRSLDRTIDIAHSKEIIPGTKSYAPIELMYNHTDKEWDVRRYGADLYMLGSLIFFYFTQTNMSAAILSKLDKQLKPENWNGPAYSEVLPYIVSAFEEVLSVFENEYTIPYKNDIIEVLRQLCNPDPVKRGHPLSKIPKYSNHYSLERYVSKLDLLASKAEVGLLN